MTKISKFLARNFWIGAGLTALLWLLSIIGPFSIATFVNMFIVPFADILPAFLEWVIVILGSTGMLSCICCFGSLGTLLLFVFVMGVLKDASNRSY